MARCPDRPRRSDLATRGVVDAAFSQFLDASGAEAAVVAAPDHAAARAIIHGGGLPGVRIVVSAP